MEDRDKLAAEYYHKLAESAWNRFHSRREMEWKAAIGIWSFFGVATVAVISARSWSPNFWTAVIGAVLSLIIVGVYYSQWLTKLAETFERDQRTSYYWESGIQLLLNKRLTNFFGP